MVNGNVLSATNTGQRLIYAVRRVSGRAGHFQDETVWKASADSRVDPSGSALWEPVGSEAVRIAKVLLDQERRGEVKSAARKAVLRLVKRCRRVVKDYWSARDYRRLPNRFMHRISSLVRDGRSPEPRLLPLVKQSGKRSELRLEYRLPERQRLQTALVWSMLFGVLTGRLRVCGRCQGLFVASLQTKRLRTCAACRGQGVTVLPRLRATGFSVRQERDYTLLRKRLNQRVYRGGMQRDERDRDLAQALQDLKDLKARNTSLEAWEEKWLEATRQPRGRRPGSFLKSGQAKVKRGTIPGTGAAKERWKRR